MVVTAKNDVDTRLADQCPVLADVEVGEGNDEIGAVLAQLRRRCFGGFKDQHKPDAAARARQVRRFGREQAHDADLEFADIAHHRCYRATERLAVGAERIGGKPGEIRFRDALLQHVVAEVELMVAEARDIELKGIQQVDHLRALGQTRHDRW